MAAPRAARAGRWAVWEVDVDQHVCDSGEKRAGEKVVEGGSDGDQVAWMQAQASASVVGESIVSMFYIL